MIILNEEMKFVSLCFSKEGDCWVFVLAALLLKQISMIVMLETMIQHPGTVKCALVVCL